MRPGSPAFGFSTLTTSAPSSASASVQVGPASNCDRSRTRTPVRQFGATAVSSMSFLPFEVARLRLASGAAAGSDRRVVARGLEELVDRGAILAAETMRGGHAVKLLRRRGDD